jgi:hypothetical protein
MRGSLLLPLHNRSRDSSADERTGGEQCCVQKACTWHLV